MSYSMTRSFLALRDLRDRTAEVVTLRRELGILRPENLTSLAAQNAALATYAAGLIGGYNVPFIRLPRLEL